MRDTRLEARDIARLVPIRQLLTHYGWRIRGRSRADCGLCQEGHRRFASVYFNERLWKCHRCQAGGDAYSLVTAITGGQFIDALRFLADFAGVDLQKRKRPPPQVVRKTQDLESATSNLQARVRWYLFEITEFLHWLDRARAAAERQLDCDPDCEAAWTFLADSEDALRRHNCEFQLLAHGAVSLKADFVLHPDRQADIVTGLLMKGYVSDDEGHQFAVGEIT